MRVSRPVLKLVLAIVLSLFAASAFAGDGTILRTKGRPIPEQYIVQFTSGQDVRSTVNELALGYAARVLYVYEHALQGAAFQMNEHQARAMARNPKVKLVEEDAMATIVGTQPNPPSWGLDRVDQRNLPLNASYTWDFDGTGVNAYVIDTGIRLTHQDFGGRVFHGTDTVGDGQNGNDCHGHGTHVAGTLGGSSYGVAKNVRLFRVRVLNCAGNGSESGIIAGVDWVTANRILPAVANMSLTIFGISTSLDTAVNNSVNSGVFYSIAAANFNADACNYSPARAANAYTVAASTQTDARASFSNFGTCVEIFAPGEGITSDWYTSDTATNTISGTSMAAPHVAGAAAILLSSNSSLTPAQVASTLTNNATVGVLTNIGAGSPNRLLYTRLSPQSCVANSTTLCFQGNRFKAQVTWRNGGPSNPGFAIPYSNEGGFFWFSGSTNPEVGVKVMDGRPVNGKWWIFHGALTTLEYTLTVTDMTTGVVKTYFKAAGSVCGGADTGAFSLASQASSKGFAMPLDVGSVDVEPAAVTKALCTPTSTSVCLLGSRFRVEVKRSGVAQPAVLLTSQSGVFWFFSSTNPEVAVKVLDGTPVNGRYWVFFAPLTDQVYQVVVTDTNTGAVKTYNSPPPYCGIADTSAF